MTPLTDIAPAFVAMTRDIRICTLATVDVRGRPRTRMVQPIWEWDGEHLSGCVLVTDTPVKRAQLEACAFVSCSYWKPNQDTCLAECSAQWATDDAARQRAWDLFENTSTPVGYDPGIIGWEDIHSDTYGALTLEPWRLRVMPGTIMTQGTGDVRSWRDLRSR